MPDIIQHLKSAYISNPAETLSLLPEVIQQYDEGLIKVLPCKENTKLWHIYDKEKGPQECYANEDNIFLIMRRLGKTVFTTREDAEKALKENKHDS